ncbi:34870_t:CDS:1, partial [Gigaspora margarita]
LENVPEEPVKNSQIVVTINALEKLQQQVTLQNQTIEQLQQQVQKLETFNQQLLHLIPNTYNKELIFL